jgi:hypothetical protein
LRPKSQVPRCTSATEGSVGAGSKSASSQPDVLLGVGEAGMTTSFVGTTGPVTEPEPE